MEIEIQIVTEMKSWQTAIQGGGACRSFGQLVKSKVAYLSKAATAPPPPPHVDPPLMHPTIFYLKFRQQLFLGKMLFTAKNYLALFFGCFGS